MNPRVILSCIFAARSFSSVSAGSIDIGSPSPPGASVEVSPGSWNVNASGSDIWVSAL